MIASKGAGPPENEVPAPTTRPAPTTTTTVDTADHTARQRQAHRGRGTELLKQLRRRHEAAKRMPPLEHSRRCDPLTARERVDGWPRP